MTNNNVFNTEGNPLYVINKQGTPLYSVDTLAANVIKYNSFTGTQSNTAIWTPASGKSIYLTAINLFTTVGLNLSLSRSSGGTFLSLTFSSNYSTDYSVPVKFNTNESILISFTLALGTVSVTLFGFEM